MRYLLTIIFLISTQCYSQDFPETIDRFAQAGIPAKFIGIHDPGFVEIELNSGQRIDTTYSGVEWETLYEWEEKVEQLGEKRDVKITYSTSEGVSVVDSETDIVFQLNGVIEPHPIDLAGDECEAQFADTTGSEACKKLVLEAWDAELNRAYSSLGGSANEQLKAAQLAWIKFRDLQIEYLQAEYGNRKGTIWGLVYLSHVVAITKEQAMRLTSISEW